MRKYPRLLSCFVVALFGCTSVPVNLGPAENVSYDAERGREISAEACGFKLLLWIPIRVNSRAQRAYESLNEQARGDYVADVMVQERWFYGLVGTGYCTKLVAVAYPKL